MATHNSLLYRMQFGRFADRLVRCDVHLGNYRRQITRPLTARFRVRWSARDFPGASTTGRVTTTAGFHNGRTASQYHNGRTTSQYDTPLLNLVERLHKEHPGRCVLVRVGDFYELYLDQATKYGKQLGLNVTRKKYGSHSVPFTGFPAKQLERYLDLLVRHHGNSVALAEQMRNQNGGFDRRVIRVVTPATYLADDDSPFSNYLLAIDVGDSSTRALGLAWVDLSTGHFMTQQVMESALDAALVRIRPIEVLASEDLLADKSYAFDDTMKRLKTFPFNPRPSIAHISDHDLRTLLQRTTKSPFDFAKSGRPHGLAYEAETGEAACSMGQVLLGPEWKTPEFRAAILLLSYLRDTQMENSPHLRWPPEKFEASETVTLDRFTIQSLELVRSLQDSSSIRGSLLHAINNTKTHQGGRLLAQRLLAPLKSLDAINARVNVVDFFYANKRLRDDCQHILQSTPDASTSVQRINLKDSRLLDLRRIVSALKSAEQIRELMKCGAEEMKTRGGVVSSAVLEVIDMLDTNDELRKLIENCLAVASPVEAAYDEGDASTDNSLDTSDAAGGSGNWRMKCDASDELRRQHEIRAELEKERKRMEDQLEAEGPALGGQEKSSAPIKKNWSGLRLILPTGRDEACVEVRRGELALPALRQKYAAKRYHYEPWTRLAFQITGNRGLILQAEDELAEKLFKEVRDCCLALNMSFDALWQVDVSCGLAALAQDRKYVKPELEERLETNIRGGRHPVVENYLAEDSDTFVKNDCFLNEARRLWLLTGPNMGGKSTFLRQNALITILAQIGSYVPADSARLGIVDAIYSRVGGADNLAQHQSTFMVEMQETANILTNATSKSLVIMDEVGRGTATEEGCAIACATLEHLFNQTRCRVIFATHFREIPRMLDCQTAVRTGDEAGTPVPGEYDKVECYRCAVVKQGGHVSRTFRIEPGLSEESYALHVAEEAGMRRTVCERAEELVKLTAAAKAVRGSATVVAAGIDYLQIAKSACSRLEKNSTEELLRHAHEHLTQLEKEISKPSST